MEINQLIKDKITIGVWCAIGGSIATMIIGFNWGGWVRGSTSVDMGVKMAQEAVVDRLAPICVSQFNKDPQREKNILTLKGLNSWERGTYVEKQGWAIMPSEETFDRDVASKCSDLILKESS